MQIEYEDLNHAEKVIGSEFQKEWDEIVEAIRTMPLHLKASDQDKIQGNLIFDPIGTNKYIKSSVMGVDRGWRSGIPIPRELSFLGTDVDFMKPGLLIEVQFSNYPFFLNNTIRSELLYQSKALMAGEPIQALIVITKGKMFPASNSTLYYEQAKKQLGGLSEHNVLDIPIRLVGLFEEPDATLDVKYTQYAAKRYSRTVFQQEDRKCRISPGLGPNSRCSLTLV